MEVLFSKAGPAGNLLEGTEILPTLPQLHGKHPSLDVGVGWERNTHLKAHFTGAMISGVILARPILRNSIPGIHTDFSLGIQPFILEL